MVSIYLFLGKTLITYSISQFVLTSNFQYRRFINGRSTLVCTSRYVNCYSCYSTAPTTCFSFTTLTLFSFSHWTTIKPIFRNAILSRRKEITLRMSDLPMKTTFKDERQIATEHGAWSRGSFGNCHWLAKRIRWFARLQSQENLRPKYKWSLWSHVLTMS